MTAMTIGAVARSAGVSIDTIRYYERIGLVASADRTAAGYRVYSPEATARFRFIKHAQQFGFTLAEIRELLTLQFDAGAPCAEIGARALDKVAEIDVKIAGLAAVKSTLLDLVARCETERPDHCTVLLGADGEAARAIAPRLRRP
ncbi:MAG TPA: heavy metal-responsive transcriptional regulator [Thermomicrobiales bacterium]|nr:heavy metal-responsive transcriptional regulator [Thermomicrobiales bacterium]